MQERLNGLPKAPPPLFRRWRPASSRTSGHGAEAPGILVWTRVGASSYLASMGTRHTSTWHILDDHDPRSRITLATHGVVAGEAPAEVAMSRLTRYFAAIVVVGPPLRTENPYENPRS